MFRAMLKSKIHRAAGTQYELLYVGWITIDADPVDSADYREANCFTSSTLSTAAGWRPTLSRCPPGGNIAGISAAAIQRVSTSRHGDKLIITANANANANANATVAEERARKGAHLVVVSGGNQMVDRASTLAAVPNGYGLSAGDRAELVRE